MSELQATSLIIIFFNVITFASLAIMLKDVRDKLDKDNNENK